jgi:hypothetical protein
MRTAKIAGFLFIAAVIIFVLLLVPSAARPSQEGPIKPEKDQHVPLISSLEGRDLFRAYCASCHGADGKGGGPVAPALKNDLPDLTTIAKRNGGIFPAERVRRIIAGEDAIIAHGSREMPVWGPIFHQIELDRDFGNVRLHNVTNHIESIQQK